jgi:large subunit ribosomal protein L15
MFTLDTLTPLVKKRKRVGRGGERGGTSGRGHKGQKARTSGTVRPGFEGGQMPIYRRLPKRGFNNHAFQVEMVIINLGQLNEVCQDGQEVTKEFLMEKGLIKPGKSKKNVLLKVLANGILTKKNLIVHADKCSAAAGVAIENLGGKVHFVA